MNEQIERKRNIAMPIRIFLVSLLPLVVMGASVAGDEARWPQFRGPNGSGIALDSKKLPVEFGTDKNILWKTPLPSGHSSPCVWDDRIFLTGFDKASKKLETLCLDRSSGQILWRRTAPAEKIEKVHERSSPAAPRPVTDGQRVYVYFGSYGLLCYDFEGPQRCARSALALILSRAGLRGIGSWRRGRVRGK